jgi:hypothetical protein
MSFATFEKPKENYSNQDDDKPIRVCKCRRDLESKRWSDEFCKDCGDKYTWEARRLLYINAEWEGEFDTRFVGLTLKELKRLLEEID